MHVLLNYTHAQAVCTRPYIEGLGTRLKTIQGDLTNPVTLQSWASKNWPDKAGGCIIEGETHCKLSVGTLACGFREVAVLYR